MDLGRAQPIWGSEILCSWNEALRDKMFFPFTVVLSAPLSSLRQYTAPRRGLSARPCCIHGCESCSPRIIVVGVHWSDLVSNEELGRSSSAARSAACFRQLGHVLRQPDNRLTSSTRHVQTGNDLTADHLAAGAVGCSDVFRRPLGEASTCTVNPTVPKIGRWTLKFGYMD